MHHLHVIGKNGQKLHHLHELVKMVKSCIICTFWQKIVKSFIICTFWQKLSKVSSFARIGKKGQKLCMTITCYGGIRTHNFRENVVEADHSPYFYTIIEFKRWNDYFAKYEHLLIRFQGVQSLNFLLVLMCIIVIICVLIQEKHII